ncbi:uncharacterized protein BDCG_17467 [Blastomyces dermatitidis ER-3]|uniref:Uncharacterized protein n=2 Tax=Blastomyces TaxID=229219 RepID=A0A179V1H0_BLAGS|nr:uncharacterized protein BDBG_17978 [Blastomyces gilchristii SLH14081]XP_045281990.1 uncharacterized protein BDCG_17467 [Blastomyces dermatitidis ER-3]EQL33994.1 hypothetical protein BDFG_04134 [Blastomyces dermatitidis ATCC 26199]OAT02263.1 hypothetical protein BDCG_17467 [Blastomyces dermatitidis ER-3]OAT14165.1 hypothetical protein BDBG_17978 [Blastomyces gilchristii SLH14081]
MDYLSGDSVDIHGYSNNILLSFRESVDLLDGIPRQYSEPPPNRVQALANGFDGSPGMNNNGEQ